MIVLLLILCANNLGHSTQLQPTSLVVAVEKSVAAHGLLVQSGQHFRDDDHQAETEKM
jgi:hypothetical protein